MTYCKSLHTNTNSHQKSKFSWHGIYFLHFQHKNYTNLSSRNHWLSLPLDQHQKCLTSINYYHLFLIWLCECQILVMWILVKYVLYYPCWNILKFVIKSYCSYLLHLSNMLLEAGRFLEFHGKHWISLSNSTWKGCMLLRQRNREFLQQLSSHFQQI